MRTPAFADLRLFVVPLARERIQRYQRRCLINHLQSAGDGFVVLPGHVFQTVTHHMDDAQLDMGLRVDAVYRIREAFQAVHAGNQDTLKTTIFQLRQHTQPELCTSFSASHIPSSSFCPSVLIPSVRKTALFITLPFWRTFTTMQSI